MTVDVGKLREAINHPSNSVHALDSAGQEYVGIIIVAGRLDQIWKQKVWMLT